MTENPPVLDTGEPPFYQQYVQAGKNTLLKVGEITDKGITATVCLERGELLSRTTVRQISRAQVANLRPAQLVLIRKYESLLDGEA